MHFTRTLGTLALAVAFVLQGDAAKATQSTAVPSQRTWVLEAAGGFGMITAIERCGDILFIGDTRQQIRRFDMSAARLLDNLGGDRVAFPTALAADCPRRRLFLITGIPLRANASAAVQAFDLDSGDLRREYPLPAKFLPRPGGRFEAPSSLVVSGLWVPPDRSPADLLHVPASRYYDGLRLGVKLSLDTGDVEPLLVPYETMCIGAGQCPDVRVDAGMSEHGPVRVAALPTSTAIGIYETGV